jgi:hypothetical protein
LHVGGLALVFENVADLSMLFGTRVDLRGAAGGDVFLPLREKRRSEGENEEQGFNGIEDP